MNRRDRILVRRALLSALAGALALGVAACKRRLPAEKVERIPNSAQSAEAAGKTAADNPAAAGQPVDDTALAMRVRAALLAAPGLDAAAIDVSASHGVITLSGTTNSSTGRDLAGYIALRVEGVTSVRNRIVVIARS